MINKLVKMLLKKYDYELNTYTVLHPELPANKLIKPFFAIFGVITVVFVLDVVGVLNIDFNFILYFLAFVLFVAFPLSRQKDYKGEVIIVTPELLIQRVSSKKFVVIEIDKIKKFKATEIDFTVSIDDQEIRVGYEKYMSSIESLVDILEAKGKTFDKEKDYMKRPITIVVNGSTIEIVEHDEDETEEEKLTHELHKEYSVLTPGFLSDILPRDSIIYKAFVKDGNLYLELSRFEVNPGHPENTTFDPITISDGVLIFLNPDVEELLRRTENDRKASYIALDPEIDIMVEDLKDGIISEWRFKKGKADFVFAIGVGAMKTTIKYDQIIVGWNKQK